MSEIVASAVAIVPDDSGLDSNHNGLKRRQSDVSEPEEIANDSKRRRTSAGKISPEDRLASKTQTDTQPNSPNYTTKPAHKPEQGKDARRKSAVPDDKQRSKRLFGALLGNLNASQPNDRAAKRRADIEARRKAELVKQDNERLEDKQRRLRELAQHRKKQQIYVDEQDMKTRHRNQLDMANMLQTEAEPKLYYRPWDLLSDEETQIEEQLAHMRARIDEELTEFEVEKKERLASINGTTGDDRSRSNQEPPRPPVVEAVDGDFAKTAHLDSDSEPLAKPADPNEHSADGGDSSGDVESKDVQGEAATKSNGNMDIGDQKKEVVEAETEAEDDGDHVVEGDEDNVIY